MAPKPVKRTSKPSNSSYEQATFIQVELEPGEQAKCKAWEFSEDDAWGMMHQMTDDGYKITFRWDDYHECAACWILPDKEKSENAGLILTGRGSSSFKAFKQAIYKHSVLFEEIWPREQDTRGRVEIDD
jgi:hypothetical protein